MKPNGKTAALRRDTIFGRVDYCIAMLKISGFLTDAEAVKVERRVEKWCKEHGTTPHQEHLRSLDFVTPKERTNHDN